MLLTLVEAQTMSTVAGSFGYLATEYGRTHRVNEKIDVYSFRVILLELTTGRRRVPGLVDVGYVQEDNPIVDSIDPDVRDESNMREMVSVFKLGIFCTGTFPSTRPSMKQVVEYLIKCKEQVCPDGKNPKKDCDASPLLLREEEEDDDEALR